MNPEFYPKKYQRNSNYNEKKIEKVIYFLFLFLIIIWMILILLPPVIYYMGDGYSEYATGIYNFFSSVCHQYDSRSYHIFGLKTAVCSRCISVYSGFLIGTIFYPIISGFKNVKIPPFWVLVICAVPIGVDSFLEILKITDNTFASRTITGLIIGFVLPYYLVSGFIFFTKEIISKRKNILFNEQRTK